MDGIAAGHHRSPQPDNHRRVAAARLQGIDGIFFSFECGLTRLHSNREVTTMAYETGLNMEERVTSLFQPDTLLPDQFLDTYRRKLHLEPEKKLMLALLEDAVACYQKYLFAKEIKGKALFEEASEWIQHETGESIFAFESVCEGLGLNP